MKLKFLEETIDTNLNKFRKAMYKNRSIAWSVKIAIIVIGSSVTIILGFPNLEISKVIALVLSGLLTIITSIDSLLNYHSKSVQQFQLFSELSNLQNEIILLKTFKKEQITDDMLEQLFEKFNSLTGQYYSKRNETIQKSFEIKSPN